MLFSVACVCLVYVLARDLFRSRGGGLVAATAFLGFNGFLALATFGPREKTPMVLFLLVALLAMRHRRWATFGVFVALGTLTWQPVFFVLLVIGLVAIVLMPSGRLAALLRVVIGGGGDLRDRPGLLRRSPRLAHVLRGLRADQRPLHPTARRDRPARPGACSRRGTAPPSG